MDLYKSFSRHFCTISNGCANIFYAKLRILCDNIWNRKFPHAHSTGEKIEDKRNPNSRAADAWFSKTDALLLGSIEIRLKKIFHYYHTPSSIRLLNCNIPKK